MSLERNKAIIQGLFKAFNEHNLKSLDNFIAPDFVDNMLQLKDIDSFKKFEAEFIKGFPDYSETIEDMIAEGEMVWFISKLRERTQANGIFSGLHWPTQARR